MTKLTWDMSWQNEREGERTDGIHVSSDPCDVKWFRSFQLNYRILNDWIELLNTMPHDQCSNIKT